MPKSNPLERFQIEGRVILVTGATGHLGRRIARATAIAGARPILAGRSDEKLAALAHEIETDGSTCERLVVDVSDPLQCEETVARLAAGLDRLDGIVNCAYSGRTGSLDSITPRDFEVACNQSLAGPFAALRAALPLLRESARRLAGGSSIVNIASMYAHVSPDPRIYWNRGLQNPPHYGAAKAGLVQLTRYLAVHLARENIRVNSVSPGPFPSPAAFREDPDFCKRLGEKVPLGRVAAADELVGPVLFLLSDAASFITGADIPVDGGWTAW